MDVQDKVIVTTGAGGGLGRATARMLAAQGARLALVDIDEDGLAATQQACQQTDG
ncbi:MAG TPA: SDR family NAD(P)-dependent oxidoreductase, partial [Salinisphaeraceae bacterium]|nr:SDR family NAD(P)-dependent oxidoreductase [Salinisphaeraceae bacterium]